MTFEEWWEYDGSVMDEPKDLARRAYLAGLSRAHEIAVAQQTGPSVGYRTAARDIADAIAAEKGETQ